MKQHLLTSFVNDFFYSQYSSVFQKTLHWVKIKRDLGLQHKCSQRVSMSLNSTRATVFGQAKLLSSSCHLYFCWRLSFRYDPVLLWPFSSMLVVGTAVPHEADGCLCREGNFFSARSMAITQSQGRISIATKALKTALGYSPKRQLEMLHSMRTKPFPTFPFIYYTTENIMYL